MIYIIAIWTRFIIVNARFLSLYYTHAGLKITALTLRIVAIVTNSKCDGIHYCKSLLVFKSECETFIKLILNFDSLNRMHGGIFVFIACTEPKI